MSFLRRFGGNSTPAAGSAVPVVEVVEKREWHNEKEGERYFGMENFGNTCYANSVLQSLYFSQPFRELIEAYHPAPSLNSTAAPSPSNSSPVFPPLNRSTTTLATPAPRRSGSTESTPASPKKVASPPGTSAGRATIASVFGSQRRPSSSIPSDDSTPATPSMPQMEGGAPLSSQSSFSGVGVPILGTNGVLSSELPPADTTLLTTLHDLFTTISSQPRTTGTVAPMAFINQLKRDNEFFRSTLHQDAHEFLNYLVNMIAEAVEKEDKLKREAGVDSGLSLDGAKTWVHKLFEGVLTNETRCLTCETVTSRDEAFLDLSIDIEPNSSVTSCLRQFSASEMLCQRNKFSCDQCCGLQEAEKRMKIKKLPNILALHLKRFKYEESLQRHVKLTYRVVFPFELRLFNTADGVSNPDRLYELWAIVVHIGVGPHHGHYITIVRSGARWVVFDDNTVYPIEESDICKFFGDTPGQGSGYVLFYQAVDLDFKGLGLRPHAASRPPVVDSNVLAGETGASTVDHVRTVSMGEGLGLAMDIPQPNGNGAHAALPTTPVTPVADAAHSFYPMVTATPRLSDSPASLRSVPLPNVALDSPVVPMLYTTPVTPTTANGSLPSLVGGSKEVENGGGRGLREKMSARIGRSLSLGPNKDKDSNRRNSSPHDVNGSSSALLPPTNGHVDVNRSVQSINSIPPTNDHHSTADGDAVNGHLFDPVWIAAPPLTGHSHPAPASDDGSASTHSHSTSQGPTTNGNTSARRGSRASIDLFTSGAGALSGTRNFLLRKRPATNGATPSSTSLPSPDTQRSPVTPSNGSHGTIDLQLGGLSKKDLERRAKEEKKAKKEDDDRREKERQKRVKEDAKRMKEEKEEEKKREKMRRKTSVRPV